MIPGLKTDAENKANCSYWPDYVCAYTDISKAKTQGQFYYNYPGYLKKLSGLSKPLKVTIGNYGQKIESDLVPKKK